MTDASALKIDIETTKRLRLTATCEGLISWQSSSLSWCSHPYRLSVTGFALDRHCIFGSSAHMRRQA